MRELIYVLLVHVARSRKFLQRSRHFENFIIIQYIISYFLRSNLFSMRAYFNPNTSRAVIPSRHIKRSRDHEDIRVPWIWGHQSNHCDPSCDPSSTNCALSTRLLFTFFFLSFFLFLVKRNLDKDKRETPERLSNGLRISQKKMQWISLLSRGLYKVFLLIVDGSQ